MTFEQNEQNPPRVFRSDIQMLRAVAAGFVVIGHLFPTVLFGGVIWQDIFFVISGFLITSSLLPRVESNKLKDVLLKFYAHRIRRLFPAMGVLLIFIIIVTFATPRQMIMWDKTFSSVIASALLFENYNLIASSVDYFASNSLSSPLIHIWSLSVEEQFYLTWPLILFICVLFGKLLSPKHSRKVAFSFLIILAVASFCYSLFSTSINRIGSYYSIATRFWELLLGGMFVFILGWLRTITNEKVLKSIQILSPFIVWASFAAIWLNCLFVIPTDSLPGAKVLISNFAAGLILAFGDFSGKRKWEFSNVFNKKPLQFMGNISYSTYIWHWPLIILIPRLFSVNMTLPLKVLTIFVIYAVSSLSFIFVEQRFQRMPIKMDGKFTKSPICKIYIIGVVVIITTVTCALIGKSISNHLVSGSMQKLHVAAFEDQCFGAKSLSNSDCKNTFDSFNPIYSPAMVDDNFREFVKNCKIEEMIDNICNVGYTGRTSKTVLLWGDSHAAQYLPVIDLWGKNNSAQVTVAIHLGCPFTLTRPNYFHYADGEVKSETADDSCINFNKKVLDELAPKAQIVIISTASFRYITNTFDSWNEKDVGITVDGFEKVATEIPFAKNEFANSLSEIMQSEKLKRAKDNSSLFFLEDIPYTHYRAPSCLVQTTPTCFVKKSTSLLDSFLKQKVGEIEGAKFVESNSQFCDSDKCYFAIGNAPVYSDYDHITASYSISMLNWFSTWLNAK